jgi:hydrogenase nickel incorporation protein HypA/HybF
MHEFSMTQQIVENVLQEARKHDAKRVLEVRLVIGKLTFLGIEQVRFSYRVLTKGTIMERSRLHIREKDGVVRCTRCGYKGSLNYEDDSAYHVPTFTLLCPRCGNAVKIIGGRECTIERVKIAA